MRTAIALAVCTLLLLAGGTSGSADPEAPSSGAVKRLVKEYMNEETRQPRRLEIAAKLKTVHPVVMGRALSKYCKKESERAKALQLAIKLKASGLFRSLKRHYDTLDRGAIIEWCLRLRDKDGVKFLLEKWNKLSLDSKEWKRIDKGFRSFRQTAEVLDVFHSKLDDEVRELAALEILKKQLSRPDLTEEQMEDDWDELRKEFVRIYRDFPIRGYALLVTGDWVGNGVKQIGPNYRIVSGANMDLLKFPRSMEKTRLELTVWVGIEKGNGGYVSLLQTDANGRRAGFKMEFRGGSITYCTPSGRVIKGVPYTTKKWTKLMYVITRVGTGFKCEMKVDGKPILADGAFTSEPLSIGIRSLGATFLVGGIDMRFIKNK